MAKGTGKGGGGIDMSSVINEFRELKDLVSELSNKKGKVSLDTTDIDKAQKKTEKLTESIKKQDQAIGKAGQIHYFATQEEALKQLTLAWVGLEKAQSNAEKKKQKGKVMNWANAYRAQGYDESKVDKRIFEVADEHYRSFSGKRKDGSDYNSQEIFSIESLRGVFKEALERGIDINEATTHWAQQNKGRIAKAVIDEVSKQFEEIKEGSIKIPLSKMLDVSIGKGKDNTLRKKIGKAERELSEAYGQYKTKDGLTDNNIKNYIKLYSTLDEYYKKIGKSMPNQYKQFYDKIASATKSENPITEFVRQTKSEMERAAKDLVQSQFLKAEKQAKKVEKNPQPQQPQITQKQQSSMEQQEQDARKAADASQKAGNAARDAGEKAADGAEKAADALRKQSKAQDEVNAGQQSGQSTSSGEDTAQKAEKAAGALKKQAEEQKEVNRQQEKSGTSTSSEKEVTVAKSLQEQYKDALELLEQLREKQKEIEERHGSFKNAYTIARKAKSRAEHNDYEDFDEGLVTKDDYLRVIREEVKENGWKSDKVAAYYGLAREAGLKFRIGGQNEKGQMVDFSSQALARYQEMKQEELAINLELRQVNEQILAQNERILTLKKQLGIVDEGVGRKSTSKNQQKENPAWQAGLEEKEIKAVEAYIKRLKTVEKEAYNEERALAQALQKLNQIKTGDIEEIMAATPNKDTPTSKMLALMTGMPVNSKDARGKAIKSLNPEKYNEIIQKQADEAEAKLDDTQNDFNNKWAEVAEAMIGGDVFANLKPMQKGQIRKELLKYADSAKEAIDEINKQWLSGTLDTDKFSGTWAKQYIDALNDAKLAAEEKSKAKVGELDADSLFRQGGTTSLTQEQVDALHEEAAAYDELIAKKREYYGIKNPADELRIFEEDAESLFNNFDVDRSKSEYDKLFSSVESGAKTARQALIDLGKTFEMAYNPSNRDWTINPQKRANDAIQSSADSLKKDKSGVYYTSDKLYSAQKANGGYDVTSIADSLKVHVKTLADAKQAIAKMISDSFSSIEQKINIDLNSGVVSAEQAADRLASVKSFVLEVYGDLKTALGDKNGEFLIRQIQSGKLSYEDAFNLYDTGMVEQYQDQVKHAEEIKSNIRELLSQGIGTKGQGEFQIEVLTGFLDTLSTDLGLTETEVRDFKEEIQNHIENIKQTMADLDKQPKPTDLIKFIPGENPATGSQLKQEETDPFKKELQSQIDSVKFNMELMKKSILSRDPDGLLHSIFYGEDGRLKNIDFEKELDFEITRQQLFGNQEFAEQLSMLPKSLINTYEELYVEQLHLEQIQKNGLSYLQEEADIRKEIASIQQSGYDKQLDAHTLQISDEDAASNLATMEQAVEKIDDIKNRIASLNKSDKFHVADLLDLEKQLDGLDLIKSKLEENIQVLQTYKDVQRDDQYDIWMNFADKYSNYEEGDQEKKLSRLQHEIDTRAYNGEFSGQQAIDEFKKQAKELGYVLDEVAEKWNKITSDKGVIRTFEDFEKAVLDYRFSDDMHPAIPMDGKQAEKGAYNDVRNSLSSMADEIQRTQKEYDSFDSSRPVSELEEIEKKLMDLKVAFAGTYMAANDFWEGALDKQKGGASKKVKDLYTYLMSGQSFEAVNPDTSTQYRSMRKGTKLFYYDSYDEYHRANYDENDNILPDADIYQDNVISIVRANGTLSMDFDSTAKRLSTALAHMRDAIGNQFPEIRDFIETAIDELKRGASIQDLNWNSGVENFGVESTDNGWYIWSHNMTEDARKAYSEITSVFMNMDIPGSLGVLEDDIVKRVAHMSISVEDGIEKMRTAMAEFGQDPDKASEQLIKLNHLKDSINGIWTLDENDAFYEKAKELNTRDAENKLNERIKAQKELLELQSELQSMSGSASPFLYDELSHSVDQKLKDTNDIINKLTRYKDATDFYREVWTDEGLLKHAKSMKSSGVVDDYYKLFFDIAKEIRDGAATVEEARDKLYKALQFDPNAVTAPILGGNQDDVIDAEENMRKFFSSTINGYEEYIKTVAGKDEIGYLEVFKELSQVDLSQIVDMVQKINQAFKDGKLDAEGYVEGIGYLDGNDWAKNYARFLTHDDRFGHGARYLDQAPEGWKKIEGALTAPQGYEWWTNGASRFSNEYQSALVKVKETEQEVGQAGERSGEQMADGMKKATDEANNAATALDNVIYHAGKLSQLNKADTLGKMTPDRGTGYFGTGHYFTDSTLKNTPSGIGSGSGYYDKPFSSVDISYYDNLYRVATDKQGRELHSFLKNITKYAFNVDGVDFSELFTTFENLFQKNDIDQQKFQDILNELRAYADTRNDLYDRRDSVSTKFMKDLGYGGVDTRGTRYANNEYGVVIYDLKEESILQANITDELQKQGDMLERRNYAAGEVWDKDEDKRIQGLIDEQNKRLEIQEEFGRIYDRTKLEGAESDLDNAKNRIEEIDGIIERLTDSIDNADEEASKFFRDYERMGGPAPTEEEFIEHVEDMKISYQARIDELEEERKQLEAELPVLQSKLEVESQIARAAMEQAALNVDYRHQAEQFKEEWSGRVIPESAEAPAALTQSYANYIKMIESGSIDAEHAMSGMLETAKRLDIVFDESSQKWQKIQFSPEVIANLEAFKRAIPDFEDGLSAKTFDDTEAKYNELVNAIKYDSKSAEDAIKEMLSAIAEAARINNDPYGLTPSNISTPEQMKSFLDFIDVTKLSLEDIQIIMQKIGEFGGFEKLNLSSSEKMNQLIERMHELYLEQQKISDDQSLFQDSSGQLAFFDDIKEAAGETKEKLDEVKDTIGEIDGQMSLFGEGSWGPGGVYWNQTNRVGDENWSYVERLGYHQTQTVQRGIDEEGNPYTNTTLHTDFKALLADIMQTDTSILKLQEDIRRMGENGIPTNRLQENLGFLQVRRGNLQREMERYYTSPEYIPGDRHRDFYDQRIQENIQTVQNRIAQQQEVDDAGYAKFIFDTEKKLQQLNSMEQQFQNFGFDYGDIFANIRDRLIAITPQDTVGLQTLTSQINLLTQALSQAKTQDSNVQALASSYRKLANLQDTAERTGTQDAFDAIIEEKNRRANIARRINFNTLSDQERAQLAEARHRYRARRDDAANAALNNQELINPTPQEIREQNRLVQELIDSYKQLADAQDKAAKSGEIKDRQNVERIKSRRAEISQQINFHRLTPQQQDRLANERGFYRARRDDAANKELNAQIEAEEAKKAQLDATKSAANEKEQELKRIQDTYNEILKTFDKLGKAEVQVINTEGTWAGVEALEQAKEAADTASDAYVRLIEMWDNGQITDYQFQDAYDKYASGSIADLDTWDALISKAQQYYNIRYKKETGGQLTVREFQFLQQYGKLYEEIGKSAESAGEKGKEFINAVSGAQANIRDAVLSKYETRLLNLNAPGDNQTSEYNKQVEILRGNLERLRNTEFGTEQWSKAIKDLDADFNKLNTDMAMQPVDENARASLNRQMSEWIAKNGRAGEYAEQVRQLQSELAAVSSKGDQQRIAQGFDKIKAAAAEAGKTGQTFADGLIRRFKSMGQYLLTFASFYRIIGTLKQAFNIVKELDTGLMEVRKVSDESLASLREWQRGTFDQANIVGGTAAQIESSTAAWLRLGKSFTEAQEAAKASVELLNVSEFTSIDDATTALVSMRQAFDDLSYDDFIDKLNAVGDNYSSATDQLAQGMQNISAVLKTSGNDIDQSLALLTAANDITQDISKASMGVRTIALRIAGTKEAKQELEDLGEDVSDFVVQTQSKVDAQVRRFTATASNPSGVSVLDSNGRLRDTYDILLDISRVYEEIVEKDDQFGTNTSNALLELLAGKTRSNILASILQNPELLENAYVTSQNAAGTGQRELDIYLDSIEAKLQKLQNRIQELALTTMNSEFIKTTIDFLSKTIELLTSIIDKVGLLPAILGTVGTAFLSKAGKGSVLTGLLQIPGGIKTFFKGKEVQNIATSYYDAFADEIKKLGLKNNDKFVDAMMTSGVGDIEKIKAHRIWSHAIKDGMTTAQIESMDVSDALKNLNDSAYVAGEGVSHLASGFSKVTHTLGSFLTASLEIVAVIAAIKLVSMGVKTILDNTVFKNQRILEAGEAAKKAIEEANAAYQGQYDYATENADKYQKLSQGVSISEKSGIQNMSLTSEEFTEFLSINQKLADLFPTMVKGFDSQGNAILDLGSSAQDTASALQTLLDAERQQKELEIDENLPALAKSVTLRGGQLEEDQEKVEKTIQLLQGVRSILPASTTEFNPENFGMQFVSDENGSYIKFGFDDLFGQINDAVGSQISDLVGSAVNSIKEDFSEKHPEFYWGGGYDVIGGATEELYGELADELYTLLTNGEHNDIIANLFSQLKELEVQAVKDEKERAANWNSIAPSLISSMNLYKDYQTLGTDDVGTKLQNIIAQEISNLQIKDEDIARFELDPRLFIRETILDPITNAVLDESGEIDKAKIDIVSRLLSFDDSRFIDKDAYTYVQELLEKIFPDNEEAQHQIKVAVGIEYVDEESGKYINKYASAGRNERIAQILKGKGIRWSEIYNDLDQEQKSLIESASEAGQFNFNGSGLEQLISWIDRYREKQAELAKDGTLAEIFADGTYKDDVSDYSSNLTTLVSSLEKLRTGGALTAEEMTNLEESFPDMTEFTQEVLQSKGIEELGKWIEKLREGYDGLSEEGKEQVDTYAKNLRTANGAVIATQADAMKAIRSNFDYSSNATAVESERIVSSMIQPLKEQYGEDLDWNIVWQLAVNDQLSGKLDEILEKYDEYSMEWHVYVEIPQNIAELQKNIENRSSKRSALEAQNSYLNATGRNGLSSYYVSLLGIDEENIANAGEALNLAQEAYDTDQNDTNAKQLAEAQASYYQQLQQRTEDLLAQDEYNVKAVAGDYDKAGKQAERIKAEIERIKDSGERVTKETYNALAENLNSDAEMQYNAAQEWLAIVNDVSKSPAQRQTALENYTSLLSASLSSRQSVKEAENGWYTDELLEQQNKYNDLQTEASKIEEAITKTETKHQKVSHKRYEELIDNGNKQIKNLKEQRSTLRALRDATTRGTDAWRDYQSQIDDVDSSISQMENSQSEWFATMTSSVSENASLLASSLESAFSEMMSGTGLSIDTINSLIQQFSDLTGMDVSKIFYESSDGMKMNATAAEALVDAEYELQRVNLAEEIERQNRIIEKNKDVQTESARATVAAAEQRIDAAHRELSMLQALYDQQKDYFTGYQVFQRAKSSENAGDRYVEMQSYLKTFEEDFNKGLTGTDESRAYIAYFDQWGQDTVEAWKRNKTKVERYMTEDFTGLRNFMNDLVAKGYGSNDNGFYSFNIGNVEQFAADMGMSVEWVRDMLGRAEDYGATNDWVESELDGQEKIKAKTQELIYARLRYEEMKRGGADDSALANQQSVIDSLANSLDHLQENTANVVERSGKITSDEIQGAIDDINMLRSMMGDDKDANRVIENYIKTFAETRHIPLTVDLETGNIVIDYQQLEEQFSGFTAQISYEFKEGQEYNANLVTDEASYASGKEKLLGLDLEDEDVIDDLNLINQLTKEQFETINTNDGKWDDTYGEAEHALGRLAEKIGLSKDEVAQIIPMLEEYGLFIGNLNEGEWSVPTPETEPETKHEQKLSSLLRNEEKYYEEQAQAEAERIKWEEITDNSKPITEAIDTTVKDGLDTISTQNDTLNSTVSQGFSDVVSAIRGGKTVEEEAKEKQRIDYANVEYERNKAIAEAQVKAAEEQAKKEAKAHAGQQSSDEHYNPLLSQRVDIPPVEDKTDTPTVDEVIALLVQAEQQYADDQSELTGEDKQINDEFLQVIAEAKKVLSESGAASINPIELLSGLFVGSIEKDFGPRFNKAYNTIFGSLFGKIPEIDENAVDEHLVRADNVLDELGQAQTVYGEYTQTEEERQIQESLENAIAGAYEDGVDYGVEYLLAKLGEGGNVDLLNRPLVDAERLNKLGYDAGDGVATVYTSTFSNEDETVAVNFTPMLVDENGNLYGIMGPSALQTYAEEVISGVHDDYLNIQIGSVFEGEDAIAQAESAAEQIHALQEEYYADEIDAMMESIKEDAMNRLQKQAIFYKEHGDPSHKEDYYPVAVPGYSSEVTGPVEEQVAEGVLSKIDNGLAEAVDAISSPTIVADVNVDEGQVQDELDEHPYQVPVALYESMAPEAPSPNPRSSTVVGLDLDDGWSVPEVEDQEATVTINGEDDASDEITTVAQEVDALDGSEATVYAGADTSSAREELFNLRQQEAESSIEIPVKIVRSGPSGHSSSTHTSGEESGDAGANGNYTGPARANGTLMGELGPELWVDRDEGVYRLAGANGPEMVDLPDDAIVFNADQTEDLLKRDHTNTRGKALVNGNVSGPARAIEKDAGFTPANLTSGTFNTPNTNPAVTAVNANTQANKENTKATKDASKDTKTALDAFKDWLGKFVDWIDNRIDTLTKRIERFEAKAEQALKYDKKNDYIQKAMNTIADEKTYQNAKLKTKTVKSKDGAAIEIATGVSGAKKGTLLGDTMRGAVRYQKQADKVMSKAVSSGLLSKKQAKNITKLIQTGKIDIKQYNENIREVISAYEDWYLTHAKVLSNEYNNIILFNCGESLKPIRLQQKHEIWLIANAAKAEKTNWIA